MSDVPANGPEPFEFTAPLSVCLDVRHPHAYLALAPVRHFAAERGIHVDWVPFPADGLKPPPPPADDRGTRHRRFRAAYQESEIARYAEVQGITIVEPFRTVDSTPASLGHLWLRGRGSERLHGFLDAVFRGHWERSLDIADLGSVAAVLESLGEPGAEFVAFARGAGPVQLTSLRERLVAAGVFAVPSLVVEGEVFVGRAHLPMVGWILDGRAGAPPI